MCPEPNTSLAASLESNGAAIPLTDRDGAIQFTRILGLSSAASETVRPSSAALEEPMTE